MCAVLNVMRINKIMELTMITQEEAQAFDIVKEILKKKIMPERISKSEARTYLAIVLDNNPHRTICRLYLNGARKLIGTISDRKVETRTVLESIDDINKFSGDLLLTLKGYDR